MGFRYIALFNLLGLVLLGSWLAPVTSTIWDTVDNVVFWHLNALVTPNHPTFVHLLSLASVRLFDSFILGTMMILFFICAFCDRRAKGQQIAKWLSMGILMLAVAGVATLLIHDVMTYERASPTVFHPEAHMLHALTQLPVKDMSPDSFPGDHGVMAMIFAAFMLRFAPRAGGIAAVILALIITVPRLMAGAHWFSDVYMGSLTMTLILTPWVLFSPLQGMLQHKLVPWVNAVWQRLFKH